MLTGVRCFGEPFGAVFLFLPKRSPFFSNLVFVKMRGFIAFSALCPSMDDDGGCVRHGEGMAVVAGAWVCYGLGQWAGDDGMVQVQAKWLE